MHTLKILFSVCAVGIALLGCGRKHDIATGFTSDNSKGLAVSPTSITNETDLRRFLVPGLPTNVIVVYFGNPDWSRAWNDGSRLRLIWVYILPPFPAGDTMPGTIIDGFSLDITNGCLARLECLYRKLQQPRAVGKEIAIGENSRETKTSGQRLSALKLFIVSSNAIPGGQFIDAKEFQKLGYIPSKPVIEIDKLKDVRLEETIIRDSENQSHKDWIFYIRLASTDERRFQEMTTDNIGNVMFMTIDEKPVCPVFISTPVPNGIWRIEMTNEVTMEIARERFAGIGREGK